jgi:hypothetical protein
MMADMHQSVEEGAGGDNNGSGTELYAPNGSYAHGFTVLHDELVGLILPDIEVICVVENSAPFPDKLSAVTLGPGRPYGWTLAFVEHTELDSCPVRHHCHLPSEGINLAHNLAFGNTAHGGVAAHLCDLVHIHRYEACLGTHVGCCACSLAACVSCPDNDYVVLKIHSLFFLCSQK